MLLERLTRWLEINQACMRKDEMDVLYTITELHNSYKNGKDTAPRWDNIPYTMIGNLGPTGEVVLLRLINRTRSEQQQPRAWNLQDTQPIPSLWILKIQDQLPLHRFWAKQLKKLSWKDSNTE